jgi:transketolase
MKSTRDGFGDQLLLQGGIDDKIISLSADLGKATKLDLFAKQYPDRFFEIGIAENNMIGIASGLSEHGYKVFLASFAVFLTGKYDTIRCSIAYPNIPCVIVGSHGGLAIGRDGVTQMGLEDISLMRSLPNMVILNPATYNEARAITKYLCETKLESPHYLRIGRQPVDEVFDDSYRFNINSVCIVKGSANMDSVVLSTGCVLSDVLKATEGIDITVMDIPVIKPICWDVISYILSYKNVITVEDHSIIGGLGSAVAEIMAENGWRMGLNLNRIGINDIFPESGKPEDLYEKYGLSSKQISIRIQNIINND